MCRTGTRTRSRAAGTATSSSAAKEPERSSPHRSTRRSFSPAKRPTAAKRARWRAHCAAASAPRAKLLPDDLVDDVGRGEHVQVALAVFAERIDLSDAADVVVYRVRSDDAVVAEAAQETAAE